MTSFEDAKIGVGERARHALRCLIPLCGRDRRNAYKARVGTPLDTKNSLSDRKQYRKTQDWKIYYSEGLRKKKGPLTKKKGSRTRCV